VQTPWTADAARAAVASVACYAAGMVWNDVADRGLDDDEDLDAEDLDPTTTWGRRCKGSRTNHWWECGEFRR